MTTTDVVRVLIADDHQVVRTGLRTFLELQDDIQVVGEAVNGAAAVELAGRLAPDVILMDLVMPVMDGIAATREIHTQNPATQVIALTSFTEDDKVFPAIQAGACAYLLKDVSPDDLVDAIRAAHRGESRLHPDILHKLMNKVAQSPEPVPTSPTTASAGPLPSPDLSRASGTLTARELDVVRLVAKGCSNHEIAARLVISEKTVKTHVGNILSKLQLEDRTQLAIYALRTGLANPE